MATAVDVARFGAANRGLAALVTRDLRAFWATLDLNRPEVARDALLRFVPVLTEQYGEVAATVAADFYDDLRAAEPVVPGFRARMADPVPRGVVQQRTRFGAQHLFTDTPDQTLVFLTGAATKYVLQPGRITIVDSAVADPAAAGWHRETRSSRTHTSGCAFCRMLATRGAVYKRATATFAPHDDCKCVAVPSWDANAPEVSADQYAASERLDALRARAAAGEVSAQRQLEANRARVRDWIASNLD